MSVSQLSSQTFRGQCGFSLGATASPADQPSDRADGHRAAAYPPSPYHDDALIDALAEAFLDDVWGHLGFPALIPRARGGMIPIARTASSRATHWLVCTYSAWRRAQRGVKSRQQFLLHPARRRALGARVTDTFPCGYQTNFERKDSSYD